jgi:hypothetical protein
VIYPESCSDLVSLVWHLDIVSRCLDPSDAPGKIEMRAKIDVTLCPGSFSKTPWCARTQARTTLIMRFDQALSLHHIADV